jgi:hypothetical protein
MKDFLSPKQLVMNVIVAATAAVVVAVMFLSFGSHSSPAALSYAQEHALSVAKSHVGWAAFFRSPSSAENRIRTIFSRFDPHVSPRIVVAYIHDPNYSTSHFGEVTGVSIWGQSEIHLFVNVSGSSH